MEQALTVILYFTLALLCYHLTFILEWCIATLCGDVAAFHALLLLGVCAITAVDDDPRAGAFFDSHPYLTLSLLAIMGILFFLLYPLMHDLDRRIESYIASLCY